MAVVLLFLRLALLLLTPATLCTLAAKAVGRGRPNTIISYSVVGPVEGNPVYLLDYARSLSVKLIRYSSEFAWSPDGSRFAVAGKHAAQDNDEIFLLDFDAAEMKAVSNNTLYNFRPVWSPDGLQLAYLSSNNITTDLTLLSLRTGAQKRYDAVGTDAPLWSWDGAFMLFTAPYQGSPAIFRMEAANGRVSPLTPTFPFSREPSWSPDGRQIVFVATQERKSGLYLMGADGQNTRQIAPLQSPVSAPIWSPDSRYILGIFTGGKPGLYTFSLEDENLTYLGDVPYTNQPSWSPDGSRILFLSRGRHALYTISPDGSNIRRVVDGKLFITHPPSWSPDGSHILYTLRDDSNKDQLFMVGADGSDNHQMTFGGAAKLMFAWRP
jgi:Tol biopolymer transport system component